MVVTHYGWKREGEGKGGQSASQLCGSAEVVVVARGQNDGPTHQRRGDAFVEPVEAFLTRDGR
jgi:hypothetical protein